MRALDLTIEQFDAYLKRPTARGARAYKVGSSCHSEPLLVSLADFLLVSAKLLMREEIRRAGNR